MQYVLKKNMWKNRSPFFKVSSSTLAIVETISLSFLFIFCLKQCSKALLKSSTVLSKIGPTSICDKASCSLLLAIFWFALWKNLASVAAGPGPNPTRPGLNGRMFFRSVIVNAELCYSRECWFMGSTITTKFKCSFDW